MHGKTKAYDKTRNFIIVNAVFQVSYLYRIKLYIKKSLLNDNTIYIMYDNQYYKIPLSLNFDFIFRHIFFFFCTIVIV